MKSDNFTYESEQGGHIFSYRWTPDSTVPIKGIVLIVHGMAEHARRYHDFASFLVSKGYAVYANDLRGHGKTAGNAENFGYISDSGGWNLMIDDMHQLAGIIQNEYPDVPKFLFGHSLGAILSRGYIIRHKNSVQGVILSSTGVVKEVIRVIALIIAKMEIFLKGKKARSQLLTHLFFGSYNKTFKPNRTEFDWLSRNEAEIDKYINDPECGATFTAGFYHDVLQGLKIINDMENIRTLPQGLPIYLLSGDKDPATDNAKGIIDVYNAYKEAGIADVTYQIYKDARHELLNEINKDEVFLDIIKWLQAHNKKEGSFI
jgi:alpha-beta hydrolase superfamily lysophospholipase